MYAEDLVECDGCGDVFPEEDLDERHGSSLAGADVEMQLCGDCAEGWDSL